MIRNLDTGLLRAFTTVADGRSMTAAARALHLTQGAVSQQIARLEALGGAKLFVRDRGGLRLTPAGEQLLVKARRLIALNDEIWADIAGTTVGGPVRLGVPPDLVGTLVAPALKSFAAVFPQVELSLVCGASEELVKRHADGEFDLAIAEEPAASAGGECLAVERLVWAGARGGSAHLRTPLPVSLVTETCAFRPAVLSALEKQARTWRTLFESGSLDATFATVRADLAVSAWLASTVPAELDILGPDAGLPDLPSFAVTLHGPKPSASPAARELAGRLRDALTRYRQAAFPSAASSLAPSPLPA